jgi:hypothetical protein
MNNDLMSPVIHVAVRMKAQGTDNGDKSKGVSEDLHFCVLSSPTRLGLNESRSAKKLLVDGGHQVVGTGFSQQQKTGSCLRDNK